MPDPSFQVHLDEHDRVVYCSWRAGTDCTLQDAEEVTRQIAAITAGRPLPVFVDMRALSSLSYDTRRYFGDGNGRTSAVALLVSSEVSHMLAAFFLGTKTLTKPTRMFTDESEALA